jgi:serine/threonine-protein kinase RsbW
MLIQAKGVMARVESHGMDGGTGTERSLSRAAEVVPLLDEVAAAMIEYGYPQRTCWEVRLILEEAIVNGLKHGNGGDPSKQVRVRYLVQSEAVFAEVEDEGPGFDPSEVADPTDPENWQRPSGRGLLLMRHYATWLRYHGRGNRLSLCKYRPDVPGLPI